MSIEASPVEGWAVPDRQRVGSYPLDAPTEEHHMRVSEFLGERRHFLCDPTDDGGYLAQVAVALRP
jgi:hypothetical protein